eukprot:6206113-Pleurochrysis_carterae.AAC.2
MQTFTVARNDYSGARVVPYMKPGKRCRAITSSLAFFIASVTLTAKALWTFRTLLSHAPRPIKSLSKFISFMSSGSSAHALARQSNAARSQQPIHQVKLGPITSKMGWA